MKATLNDGTVLDGSFEEITNALRALRDKAPNGHSSVPKVVDDGHSALVWTPRRAEAFWGSLSGGQKELVQFVVDKGGTARMKEIMQHLNLRQGVQLAGLLSGITRNARRETGYRDAEVIGWHVADDGKWRYAIRNEVYELLKQIANKRLP